MLLNDVQEPLLETSKRINRIVAAEDALFPGEIRTGGVEVSTIQGRYVPPMLTEDGLCLQSVSSLFVSTLLTSIQLVINKYFNNSLAIYK